MKIQRLYTIEETRLLFGGRSSRWVTRHIKAGDFGEVIRDAGGWLIPEAGIQGYLARHRISREDIPAGLREEPAQNVVNLPAA